jgi:hypothetical protein
MIGYPLYINGCRVDHAPAATSHAALIGCDCSSASAKTKARAARVASCCGSNRGMGNSHGYPGQLFVGWPGAAFGMGRVLGAVGPSDYDVLPYGVGW